MKTIEIGIDLGTTNSSISIVNKGEAEIIKNARGEESTPSFVLADKNGNLIVGSKAKSKANEDRNPENIKNCKSEIKRLMGTDEKVYFPNLGKELSAESISSEIIKSLILDLNRRYPDINTKAAVITIPAHFSTLQSEATKRAGELAGFDYTVLLQEPIAAAVSYGLSTNTNENWLVYDLGGGTFDVALVASRDGGLTVLAHGGDNFLGGKDIDSEIVDNFLIPKLQEKNHQYNFIEQQNLYKKLCSIAEQGKIDLSMSDSTYIDVELEINGKEISETFLFSRSDLLRSCQTIFDKTIRICKSTLKESHVDLATVKKIVLVGGPTQMPILRDYLQQELNITVDGSQDPLTVVAKGAALYAQQVPIENSKRKEEEGLPSFHDYKIEINYSPVTSENEQTITGIVKSNHPNSTVSKAATISFQAEDKSYSSGDILLRNSKFITQISTQEKSSKYWIYLKDDTGQLLNCDPDYITISRGVSIAGAPLPHSIGVSILSYNAALGAGGVDEVMDIFFKRNSILPLSATKRFYTAQPIIASDNENALPIRIYEGESLTPDRNTLVCDVAVTGEKVNADLKKGSAVDITIAVDESRQLSVSAYLPDIDLTLNARATIYDENISVEEMKKSFDDQSKRSEGISEENTLSNKQELNEMISDLKSTLSKGDGDSDQKRKALKQLKDLMVALDGSEAEMAFDKNTAEFYKLCDEVSDYIIKANPADRRQEYDEIFQTLKREGTQAIDAKDPVITAHSLEKLERHYWSWLFSDPAFLIRLLNDAKADPSGCNNMDEFNRLIQQGEKAIQDNNIQALREATLSVMSLIRDNKPVSLISLKSGIMK